MKKYEVADSLSKFLGKDNRNLLLKYVLEKELDLQEINELEEIYLRNIEKQKKIVANKIKLENIEILISYISYSYSENESVYMENILDKNLRIFPNIKYFLLIYSKETEDIFLKIKERYSNIEVNGILLEENTNFHIQNKMERYLSKFKPNKNNTVIDITLGMKIITVYFYKLAVEREIYSINWQEKQVPIYTYSKEKDEYIRERGMKRYPFNTKLEIMIEPQKENIKIYEYINKSLKEFNFSATESYYNQLGNYEMEIFYRGLSKLFSFQNMLSLDVESFYSQLEKFFIVLSKIPSITRENLLKLKPFLSNLLTLILFEVTEENIETRKFYWLNSFLSKFQIKSEDLLENGFFAEYRDEIYYFLLLEYFESKKEENNIYYYEKFIKDIRKSILKELGNEDKNIERIFLKEGDILEILDIDLEDILEKINPSKILLENIRGDFYFENKILYIEKYNLKIDCEKDVRVSFINNKGADVIREILKNYESAFSGEELFNKIAKYKAEESEKSRSNRFRKNLSVFKHKIEDFNNLVKEIGREDGIELGDLILYTKLEGEKSDFLHQFKVNPKFYTLV